MSIGVAGLSHLGIVTAVASAVKGCHVVAYDPDEGRCGALRRGAVPVAEPQLAGLLAAHADRIHFTSDPGALSRCAVIVVSVDTPTDQGNRPDASVVARLAEDAAAQAAAHTVVVIHSQVPPGFTRALALRLAGRNVAVFHQVETLIIGCAVERALQPERFIVGCANPAEILPEAYRLWLEKFGCPIMVMRYESAEVAKIAVNLFLASSVSTTNTLAELCEAVGADWSDVRPALMSDRRIGPHAYLTPGLGLSGGNLERDLAVFQELAQRKGTHAAVIDAFLLNSRHRRNWVLDMLRRELGAEAVVAVWGLAYKVGTNSTRNSPALSLLEGAGFWRMRVYDPQAVLEPGRPSAVHTASALEACQGADALAVMTPWPEFAAVDAGLARSAMRGRVVLDPFGVLDGAQYRHAGCAYRRLGVQDMEAVAQVA